MNSVPWTDNRGWIFIVASDNIALYEIKYNSEFTSEHYNVQNTHTVHTVHY